MEAVTTAGWKTVTQTLVIESASRADLNRSGPNDYHVEFPPLQNVYGLRITHAAVPNSQYTLHSGNNTIDFYDTGAGGVHYVAVLTPGFYELKDLAPEVDRAMNAAMSGAPGSAFTCAFDTITQRLTVTRSGGQQFRLLGLTGTYRRTSACQVLGMEPGVDTSLTTTGTMILPRIAQVQGDEYVFVCLRGVQGMSTSCGLPDAVAKVIFPTAARNSTGFSLCASQVLFPALQRELRSFQVRVVRPRGQTLYDFNGMEHCFAVELYCLVASEAQ
jgi:hypothetical protein